MRRFQLDALFARFGGRLGGRLGGQRGQRAAVWCMVLMASMIAARAVQRMAAPALEHTDAPQRQQAAPSLLDLDPPECNSALGATDPRCAHAPRFPQPGAATPLRPTSQWTREAGSPASGPALTIDAADSGMQRSPRETAASPARAHGSTARRSRLRRARAYDDASGRQVIGHEAAGREAVDDLLDTADQADVDARDQVAPPSRIRIVTPAKTERPGRRSRTGDSDPFERLDRMRLQ
jgi:hypothetical protein